MRFVSQKISLLLALGFIISFPITASAQSVEELLIILNAKTESILEKVKVLTLAAEAWMKPADSSPTKDIQAQFSEYGAAAITNINLQQDAALGKKLSDELFIGNGMQPSSLANELSSYSLMNQLYYNSKNEKLTASDYAYKYLINAGGTKIQHPIEPGTGFKGLARDQERYRNYFNSIMSVQSYNGYLLSHLYAESMNNNAERTTRTKLIAMATDGKDWFEKVASEPIGIVLRQILMFESQSFVLLSQMLDTQKQLLAATTMNNTLLILLNQNNESTMWSKANTAGT